MRFNGQSLFTPGQIFGTRTNDNAGVGKVGEIIESTVLVGAPVALTVSGTAYDITSISLTAGDWDAWAVASFIPNAATTITGFASGISTTSATLPTAPGAGAYLVHNWPFTTGNGQSFPVGMRRLILAATTTVYLVSVAGFAVNTMGGYGYLGARRVR